MWNVMWKWEEYGDEKYTKCHSLHFVHMKMMMMPRGVSVREKAGKSSRASWWRRAPRFNNIESTHVVLYKHSHSIFFPPHSQLFLLSLVFGQRKKNKRRTQPKNFLTQIICLSAQFHWLCVYIVKYWVIRREILPESSLAAVRHALKAPTAEVTKPPVFYLILTSVFALLFVFLRFFRIRIWSSSAKG